MRWQERVGASSGAAAPSPGATTPNAVPMSPESAPGSRGSPVEGAAAPSEAPSNGSIRLGTYRDLWAGEITERNPALRFLAPEQRLELAPAGAERLGVEDAAVVLVTGHGASAEERDNPRSVIARVAVRGRMRPGTGFLVEGTSDNNPNVLAGTETVEVSPAPAAESP